MKTSTVNKKKYYLFGILFIFILWGAISLLFDENNMIFPNMFKVIKKTYLLLGNSFVYKCLGYSLLKLLIGFIGAFILALIVGTIAGTYQKFKYFIYPFIMILKSIPTASLVFLFLVIAGVKYAPIYIVVLICFPILYESVLAGYENIDKSINMAIALEPNSLIVKIIKIRLPLAKPYIVVGIASTLGLSFKIEVMAEVLTGSTTNGIGAAIGYIERTNPTDMVSIFAYSIIAIVISMIISLVCEKTLENN